MTQALETETSRMVRVDSDLYQTVKLCAAHEGRQIKELTEEALRQYIESRDYQIVVHNSASR
jgi:predicted transcriptional regulator